MALLVSILLHSPEPSAQRRFYEHQLGLVGQGEADGAVHFHTVGAALALRPQSVAAPPSIELWVRAADLDRKLLSLSAHGIQPEGAVESLPEGRVARLRDPDGNAICLVQLVQDSPGSTGPRVSHVFVNTLDLAATAEYYREVLGLRVANESEHWVEFDTGETVLALHASQDTEGLPLHPDQRVSFALHRDDFDAWTEELRARGVRFAAAPVEEELGVIAEVEDADGWCVVLHGPAAFDETRQTLAYDDDANILRGGLRPTDDDSAQGSEFASRKQAKKRRDKLMTRALHAFQRGDGGLAPRGTLPREPREPRS